MGETSTIHEYDYPVPAITVGTATDVSVVSLAWLISHPTLRLDDYPVPAITVDADTDVSVVSHAWLMSHPTLRSVIIQPVPPTAVALRAANGMIKSEEENCSPP